MRSKLFAGFDVGGTKALGVVVASSSSPNSATPSYEASATPPYEVIASARDSSAGDGMELTKTLANLCEQLVAQTGNTRFEHIGLAVAGLSDRTGIVHYSPNLPDIVEFALTQSLAEEIASRLGYQPSVSLDNDANAGAWAEAHLGAGRGSDNFVFLTLGTGVGTGFVLDGRLILGANGFAGESGHMVVDASGPAHITGVQGPWEHFASGMALRRMGSEAAAAGRFDAGLEFAGSAEDVTSHHVHDAVKANDAQALEILDSYSAHVALGIANIVMIMDPQRIVIGGGIADIGEPLRSRVESHLPKTILGASYRPMPEVALAELGEEAIAIGAALMANDRASAT